MKLVHESIIQRSEIFQAFGAGFFETFEEEDLGTRIYLFQELTQLGHSVAAGRYAEDIMDKALDELLSDILTGEITIRELSCS